jgi:dTDP-4-amino-4,6-dideoxygalactose transaminase
MPAPGPPASRLAVLGGTPRFARKLHVGAPNIGRRASLMRRLRDVLDRRWLTNHGQQVQAFEARLAAHIGARHCIAVCNATIGLELLVRALRLSGEVILPSFTFIATAHVLQWLGIRPVFCDIDPATHLLDPAQVEALITPRTSAILGVHIWGNPCAPERLAAIARRHRLALLFDAAHAFGCARGPVMIGNFGRAEVFSFHATKFVNTLEGGAIATNDDALAASLRRMLNFGFAGVDVVSGLGLNGKMHEFSAAMGLTSLESMEHFLAHNARNQDCYRAGLAALPGFRVLAPAPGDRSNHHYVVVEVDAARAGLSRDELVAALWEEGVLARRYFTPGCHMMEPYRSETPGIAVHLPATTALCERVMVLPNGTAVRAVDVRRCCALIAEMLQQRDAVRRALAQPGRARPWATAIAAPTQAPRGAALADSLLEAAGQDAGDF